MKRIVVSFILLAVLVSLEVRATEVDSVIYRVQQSEVVKEERVPAKKFDRGLNDNTFMPKGTITLGASLTYTSLDAEDYQFLLFDDLTAAYKTIGARVNFAYTFADNIAAGVQFQYSRNTATIDNVDMSLSEDLQFSISDYYTVQQVFTGSAYIRTYINVGNSRVIGMFNDVKVYFAGGQGKVTDGPDGPSLVGTYEKITKMGLVLAPGVSIFTADFMAIEASIGILGVEYSRTEQTTNQVYQGTYEYVNASFKLDLLSLGVGIAFYF